MRFKKQRQYRLPYFNYASSALYFITVCSHKKSDIFGTIHQGVMNKSWIGDIVELCLKNVPYSSPYASLDSFVIMPDHIHAIIVIENPDVPSALSFKRFSPERNSLSIAVRNFKSAVTIFSRKKFPGINIWQSRFYDKIIRNENELNAIRKYIENNPMEWSVSKEQAENVIALK